MRAIELAKVAAAAEALRLRRLARRQLWRAIYAVAAVLFGLAAFTGLHALIYVLLRFAVAPWLALVILLVIDMVIFGVLASLVLNSQPDRIEREAQDIRRDSLVGARRAVTFMSVAGEVAGLAMNRTVRKTIRRPGLGRALMVADIVSRFAKRR